MLYLVLVLYSFLRQSSPKRRPVHKHSNICSTTKHLYHCFSTSHATHTPTMRPRTPVQRLLLLPQTPTPLTTLLTSCALQSCSRSQSTTRLFSSSPSTHAGVRKSRSFQPNQTGMKQPSQKSFEVMKKEQMKNLEQMPNDVGLIPGTFIMPTGSRLPGLTDNFGLRFQLEKHRLWLRMKEVFGYVLLLPFPAFMPCRLSCCLRD